MTENEAKEMLATHYEFLMESWKPYPDGKVLDAIGIAISSIDKIQQYRAIGTVEECREARERQIPKKPVCKQMPYSEEVGLNDEWRCPTCGEYVGYFTEEMEEPEQMEYCVNCGQHIKRDWSE